MKSPTASILSATLLVIMLLTASFVDYADGSATALRGSRTETNTYNLLTPTERVLSEDDEDDDEEESSVDCEDSEDHPCSTPDILDPYVSASTLDVDSMNDSVEDFDSGDEFTDSDDGPECENSADHPCSTPDAVSTHVSTNAMDNEEPEDSVDSVDSEETDDTDDSIDSEEDEEEVE
jgi:hypothetical protein